jgi:hypothetical protein
MTFDVKQRRWKNLRGLSPFLHRVPRDFPGQRQRLTARRARWLVFDSPSLFEWPVVSLPEVHDPFSSGRATGLTQRGRVQQPSSRINELFAAGSYHAGQGTLRELRTFRLSV